MTVAPELQTLYDYHGNPSIERYSDVPRLVDGRLPADARLYIRCPLCVVLPNHGIHAAGSMDRCPSKNSDSRMAQRLGPYLITALREWHEALVAAHLCTAENEGQSCCIDRLMPGFVAPAWEQGRR